MDVLVGTAHTFWMDFSTQNGLVIPDGGSVTYTLYNDAGTPLVSNSALTPVANATGVLVPISSGNHTIGVGKDFEKRILRLSWLSGGRSYSARLDYRVIPLVLYTASPKDVRVFMGLNEDDLSDQEVDLYSAYLKVREEMTSAILDPALISGTMEEHKANQVIVMTAVLYLIPSLQLRAAQSVGDGNNTFSRISKIDYEALRRSATEIKGQAMLDISGVDEATVTIVLFSGATDPITG